MKIHSCIVVLGAVVLLKAIVVAAYGEGGGSLMSLKPVHEEFVQGEPLEFILKLDNQGNMPIQVDLGPDGIGNLSVTVSGMGDPITAVAPHLPGFVQSVVLQADPHSSASHTIFLNDFLRLDEPGSYRVTVAVKKVDTLSPASTEFRILPYTESSQRMLERRYSELAARKDASHVALRDRMLARKAIVLSSHPLAVKGQMEILRSREWANEREYDQLVDAMVSSKSQEAIQSLVENILENPKSSTAEKSVVLNRLREAHVEKWHGLAYELLIPYLKEIQTSVPMVISD